ncbi:hypothetical protein [Microbacterium aurum]
MYTPSEIVDQSGQPPAPSAGRRGTPRGALRSAHRRQRSPRATSDLEAITYLRPSRYCQSDEVFSQARRQFRGLQGMDLINAVSEFVASSTTYTPGLSQGTDSAVTTLMTGQGCAATTRTS